MAGLRNPLTHRLEDPPPEAIRIGFWRHQTPTSEDPEIPKLHRERAKVVHQLVDATGLEVKSWGNVDTERPAEIVEILVGALVGAVVDELVKFLFEKIKQRQDGPDALMAVTIRRQGAEVVWHFQQGVTAEQAAKSITRFLEGGAVERVLER